MKKRFLVLAAALSITLTACSGDKTPAVYSLSEAVIFNDNIERGLTDYNKIVAVTITSPDGATEVYFVDFTNCDTYEVTFDMTGTHPRLQKR